MVNQFRNKVSIIYDLTIKKKRNVFKVKNFILKIKNYSDCEMLATRKYITSIFKNLQLHEIRTYIGRKC